MIDLHMHTKYSDGTDSVKEILSNANKKKLEIISITDHNTCNAYKEMETLQVTDFFNGKIIVGCEFTTSFDNRLIEVLGYNFDYYKVNEFLSNYYTEQFQKEQKMYIFNSIVNKLNSIGFIYNLDNIDLKKSNGEFFEGQFYDEIIKHKENLSIIKEDVFTSFSDFFRKGLTNPQSKLFIDYTKFKPSLKDIINLVHEAGGIIFLAHPYQYKFNDTEEFLYKIYTENSLDGIECFYTTFSNKQSEYLLNFAKKRNLLISGGSDYHGTNKKQHELGVGRGNLDISRNIISDWNIKYFKEEEQ